MARVERWSRHVGTGIGLSGHKNQYRLGVCQENWVEDDHANGARLAGAKTILSSVNDTPVPLSTCHASYTIDGKAGSELLEVHERRDYYENNGRFKAVPAPHLSGHGADPTNTYKATVSGLAYQEPQLEARRLQTYLWSGSKFNDAGVPHDVNTMHPPRKTIMNRVDAVDNREFAGNTLQATASSGPEAASLLASSKRGLIYPQCPGGQPAQTGRKVRGGFVNTFEMPHQKTGLRK